MRVFAVFAADGFGVVGSADNDIVFSHSSHCLVGEFVDDLIGLGMTGRCALRQNDGAASGDEFALHISLNASTIFSSNVPSDS